MGRFSRKNIILLLSCAIVAAVLLASMVRLDQPLRTTAAPRGIVSFELAGSPETTREILASWGKDGRRNAALSLGVDYAFLLSYALVLGLLCTGVAHEWPQSHPYVRRTGFILAGCQWLAASLDLAENILLQNILAGATASFLPLAARWCALVKFGLIACGWLYIVTAGGIRILCHRRLARGRFEV